MTEQEIDQLIYTIQLMPNASTLEKYAAIQWIRQCPPWLSVVDQRGRFPFPLWGKSQ